MDVIRFTCDTVLSDVHLLMPNSQHFMVRLNAVGQPVFLSRFKILKDCDNFDGKESYQSKLVGGNRNESHDPSEEPVEVQNCKTTGDSEPCNESVEVTVVQNLDALLDEDGDLDLIRRPLDVSDTDQLEFYRLMVHPVILSKGEEGTREVEDQYDSYPDVIRIVFLSRFKILKDCDNFDGKESYQSKLVGGNRNESHDPSEEPVEVQNCKTTGDSEPCNESVEVTVVQNLDALLDEDGDLDLIRRPLDVSDTDQLEFYRLMVHPVILSKGEEGTREVEDQYDSYPDVIRIEHTMATPLEDVGKQVWRAALLLADYILHNHFIFKNCTALELGAGTGITSIAMATTAKTIYCTDVGDDLLNMCEKNVTLNRHLAEQMGEIQVKELDWLQSDFCLDPEFPYSWSEDEIASLHDDTTVLLAADVCYDSSLTDALFRTIYKIMSNLKNPSTLYISIEKRFNFTLRHMDITCEAYDHFRSCLNDLEHITDGKTKFTVESVPITFPQHLDYERFEHLELWKVTASPVST